MRLALRCLGVASFFTYEPFGLATAGVSLQEFFFEEQDS